MTRWLFLCVATAAIAGCTDSSKDKKSDPKPGSTKDSSSDKQSLTKDPSEAKSSKSTAKTRQDAQAELQGRIDRCLGGQPVEKLFGTIGIWAVGKKMASMDIAHVVEKYDKDGTAVPNEFVALIRCVGEDTITGQRETREFESIVFGFRNGKWELFI